MRNTFRALLVHDEENPVSDIKPLLEAQGIETRRVRTCAEAEFALSCSEPPAVVLTEPVLPDGTWEQILAFSTSPVVVVSRLVDLELYLDVLESGASDFIVPPFHAADFAYVVNGAILGGRRTVTAMTMGKHVENYASRTA